MVEQLSDGVWGWKGGEGITLHKSGGGGSSGPAIVELSNEVFPKVHLGVRAALDALPDGVECVCGKRLLTRFVILAAAWRRMSFKQRDACVNLPRPRTRTVCLVIRSLK